MIKQKADITGTEDRKRTNLSVGSLKLKYLDMKWNIFINFDKLKIIHSIVDRAHIKLSRIMYIISFVFNNGMK